MISFVYMSDRQHYLRLSKVHSNGPSDQLKRSPWAQSQKQWMQLSEPQKLMSPKRPKARNIHDPNVPNLSRTYAVLVDYKQSNQT